MASQEQHSGDPVNGTARQPVDGLPDAGGLPNSESGPKYLERLLLDHSDQVTCIGKEGEAHTFDLLHLEYEEAGAAAHNRPGTRFEVRLNRETGTVRVCVVNRETTEAWPIGTGDLTRMAQIRKAHIVHDELTEIRAERLRELLG